jgi:hypothetical protein
MALRQTPVFHPVPAEALQRTPGYYFAVNAPCCDADLLFYDGQTEQSCGVCEQRYTLGYAVVATALPADAQKGPR